MAHKSSIMASAVRNTLKEWGIAFPKRLKIPNENAISVAVGIAQPLVNSVPFVKAMNIIAGTSNPLKAATNGNIILFGEESSPETASRLISIPTWKKKTAISKSLIICKVLCGKLNELKNGIPASQKALYLTPIPGKLVIIMDIAVQSKSKIPTERLSFINPFNVNSEFFRTEFSALFINDKKYFLIKLF